MPRQHFDEPIAIVGMSCRLAQCNGLDEFWNILELGMDVTSYPPADRYLQKDYATTIPENSRTINAGFLSSKVDEFDAAFFEISPKEATFMDPQQRLLHELVWEGLEDAGIDPLLLEGTSSGVFMGSWTNDYKDILLQSGCEQFYRRYMGNSIGAASAKIAYFLGMIGPCISTESGCSSAIVSVHLACRSLQMGETNMALACGVNLLLRPLDTDALAGIVSPEGRSKPFDSRADGFGRAEGGGVLVLKRLSDATKDGDRIWAIIRGSAVSQEGMSKSMGTPTIYSESLAMELALKDAGVKSFQVSLVEAHGTGTPVGDPMEMSAIAKAYNTGDRKCPLLVTSVKGNVGHSESASGIIGIIKVALAMKNEKIPKQVNFAELNPSIDLRAVPAEIPITHKDWKRNEKKPRFAGVSSYGVTGTAVHVILEEPPLLDVNTEEIKVVRPYHIVKATAKSEDALNRLLDRYKHHFRKSDDAPSDICFTANTCRTNFKYRAVVTGKSNEEIARKIVQRKYLKGEINSAEVGEKICFLFTGQGSQYAGMAQQIYKSSPIFQDSFDACARFLQTKYQINIKNVIWGQNPEDIHKTINSQTSIFCVEYALFKLWESWGVKPDYVLGHSLGEFAAAVCANMLTLEDALTLVAERSILIDNLPAGKMLAIKANQNTVASTFKVFTQKHPLAILDFAAINSNEQTVVAGDSDTIMLFSKFCEDNYMKNVVLQSNHAFHSNHMDPILEQYKQVAEKVVTRKGKEVKYISGMLGKILTNKTKLDAEYFVEHTRMPVRFLEASQTAVEYGCNMFVELGPQPVLSALTMTNANTRILCLPSLKKNNEDWSTMLNSLGTLYVNGVQINWIGLDKPYTKRERVQLPHYPFMGKRFWPEIAITHNASFHPLLGVPIRTPLLAKTFQSSINLKTLPFLVDHVVGEHIVFPGAAYLEMCLAAGITAIDEASNSFTRFVRPMSVKNLSIPAPLILNDFEASELYTVVEFRQSYESSVKIFNKSESKKWVLHANAEFEVLQSTLPQDIGKIISSSLVNKKCGDTRIMKKIYDKLASVGLKFGDIFRSLRTVWKAEENTDPIQHIFEIKCPKTGEYLIHPVLLDGMLLTLIFDRLSADMSKRKKMPIPVKVGKFIMLPPSQNYKEGHFVCILLTKNENNLQEKIAVLTDSEGQVRCIVSQVEFVDTAIKHFEALVRQQTNSMPDLWEEVWKQKVDFSKYQCHLEKSLDSSFFSSDLRNKLVQLNETPDEKTLSIYNMLGQLSFLNIVKALLECGWTLEQGNEFKTSDLRVNLLINDEHGKYFEYMLATLETEGFISKTGDENWKVVKSLPSHEDVSKEIMSPVLTEGLVKQFRESLLVFGVGKNLKNILQGKMSALNILFPTPTNTPQVDMNSSAAEFYKDYIKLTGIVNMAREVLTQRLCHLSDVIGGNRSVLRILEVGAGTGGFTELLLNILRDAEVEFEYTYTDISSSFFPAAEKKFKEKCKNIKFKVFNIEDDPLAQGFLPEYYDYICCYEVIHATRSIQETLANLRMVLKPFGKLDILDTTKENRYLTFIYGLLGGYWRFEDYHIRKSHCTMDTSTWNHSLESAGYEVEQTFSTLNSNHSLFCARHNGSEEKLQQSKPTPTWIVFYSKAVPIVEFLIQKLISTGRNVILVENESQVSRVTCEYLEGVLYSFGLDKSRNHQEEILRPLFEFVKLFLSEKISKQIKNTPHLIVLTLAATSVNEENDELNGFETSTLLGFCKSLRNESFDLNCRCIDIDDECAYADKIKMTRVFQELFNKENHAQTAFRGDSKYIPKLHAFSPLSVTHEDLTLPTITTGNADRFQLILPQTRSISDLRFGPLDKKEMQAFEVEIHVKAFSLNFRDVLAVLKPTDYFKTLNEVGIDYAGEVRKVGSSVSRWKSGDLVCGMNFNQNALPSYIQTHEDHVISIPSNLTCSEAATLPAVFVTSYIALVEMAKLKRNDYVLLHTASGGVGLAAIDLCRSIGAKIVATAGSKMKRRYLRTLGIKHVFNSRDTLYHSKIMEVTCGHGVDVVLNSLTSEGFKEATLASCANGARFIEMSKMNIWRSDEVKVRRPDVNYQIIDVSSMRPDKLKTFLDILTDNLQRGIVKPLPYLRFNAVNIRDALQFLQKTKHIGKVVCVMPEVKQIKGKMIVESRMFNKRSTYLITGGLGGIGLVVCRWMVERGAKNVVLAGRSLPTPEVLSKIKEINATFHAQCISVKLDVSNYNECETLIKDKLIKMGMPPLKGIMHAAGMLADGLIVNQTWEKLTLPFRAKVTGTINLHNVTRDLQLEYFVLFSSAAATFGSPGQCNHAAANQFMDSFAHYRRSLGLSATTLNFGPWCEVGVATEHEYPGMQSLSNKEGILSLEYALKSIRTQTAVLTVDSFGQFNTFLPQIGLYIDEVNWKNNLIQTNAGVIKPDEFWVIYDSKESAEQQEKFVKENLLNALFSVIHMNEEDFREDATFQEMGVDSLMFVEIRNGLQALFGDRVSVNVNSLMEGNANFVTKELLKHIEAAKS